MSRNPTRQTLLLQCISTMNKSFIFEKAEKAEVSRFSKYCYSGSAVKYFETEIY